MGYRLYTKNRMRQIENITHHIPHNIFKLEMQIYHGTIWGMLMKKFNQYIYKKFSVENDIPLTLKYIGFKNKTFSLQIQCTIRRTC